MSAANCTTNNKAPNQKHQAPNKSKIPMSRCLYWSLVIGHWSLFVSWCLVLGHSGGQAADSFPRVPPTPPEKAEATFEVQHGFRMELIAAEPLVVDPVDLAYDEDGRAYVVEMRDYPYPEEKN